MPQELRPGVIPIPYRKLFWELHISETILSILTKLCPNVPWVILFQSYSLVSYLFVKQDQIDFDLQLGCCISDAFSIFFKEKKYPAVTARVTRDFRPVAGF